MKDTMLFCKAFLTNQVAKFTPKLYIKYRQVTGRDEREEDGLQVAKYFIECFCDYQKHLGLNNEDIKSYLRDKVILEYGPGDILGVALLLYAYGARMVHCADRFPLSKLSDKNIDVYTHLLNSLDGEERQRAEKIFREKGNPASGFNENYVRYIITKNGLSGEKNKYDLIISRAVLEHVNDLSETILDIKQSMKKNGISLHKVDLKSHGLDRYTEFDFLTLPTFIYNLMYSHKGFPNRWRVDKYKELASISNLYIKDLIPTGRIDEVKLNIIYPNIAKEFRNITPEECSWLGFWIHITHPQ